VNRRSMVTLLALSSLLSGSGCATVESLGNISRHSPRFYAGTRLDYAAIQGDRDVLDHYSSYDILPPGYPRADIAFSFVADTVFFPFTVLYTISEPALGGR